MVTKNAFFNPIAVISITCFLMANSSMLFCQEKIITKSNQIWLQYYNETQLNDKWTLFSDGGYRWKEGFEESTQYIVRAAIGYAIAPDIRTSSGFAHLGFYSSGKISKVEFRPYQEITFKNKYNNLSLNHRFRIEERFFNAVAHGEIQTPNTFNFRFRYALMVSIPLFKLSSENPDSIFLLNIGDEVLINAGKNIINNVFDQNRIIVCPTFNLNKQLALSLTYSSQFASTTTPGNYAHTNVFWVQVKHKLNLKMKKT